MISEDDKKNIVHHLTQKFGEVDVKCPMCGHEEFIVADGYFSIPMLDNYKDMKSGTLTLPVIPIICKHCGNVSFHSLGVLGLLNGNEKKGGTDE